MDKTELEEERIRKLADQKKKQRYITVSTLVLILLTVTYTLIKRPLEDFIQYSLYTALSAATILLLIILFVWTRSGFAKPTKDDVVFNIMLFIIAIPILGISYYSIAVVIKDAYLWTSNPTISKSGAVIVTVVGTLLLGFLLFYFRLKYRSIYGATEAVVGLTVAGDRVFAEYEQPFTSTFYLAIITAAVYLVVRGLDNIHQGLTNEPKDPILSRLLSKRLVS